MGKRFDQLAPPPAEAATIEVAPSSGAAKPALTFDETPIVADEAVTPQETTASALSEAPTPLAMRHRDGLGNSCW